MQIEPFCKKILQQQQFIIFTFRFFMCFTDTKVLKKSSIILIYDSIKSRITTEAQKQP